MSGANSHFFSKQCRLLEFIVCVFLFSIAGKTYSQKQELSFSIGFGSTDILENGESKLIVSPFDLDNYQSSTIFGVNYKYYPGESDLVSFNAGLNYHSKIDAKIHQLIFPIGLNLEHGKRFTVFCGGGLLTKILLAESSITREEYNPVQLGWYYAIGCGYQITQQLGLFLSYQMNLDITKFFDKYYNSPGGASYIVEYREFEGSLRFGMAYALIQNK